MVSAPPPDREPVTGDSASPCPARLYACVYVPPSGDDGPERPLLTAIAEQFSPRYEQHRDDLVSIDVSGLEQLVGPPRTVGEELRREAGDRGVRAHVAVAGTRMAALVLALARPGLTVVPRGGEAVALESIRIEILEQVGQIGQAAGDDHRTPSATRHQDQEHAAAAAVSAFKRWGMKTLGELAALPAADLVARLGRGVLEWQAVARGDDMRPLVPTLAEERFESLLELEWPIEELEPLSFVLTRLLEPLSTRLERRDRGAAVLHVLLRLVTREVYARRLELPTPMRDVRTLRTLALLDLESHPSPAAIDRVTLVIDPTPGRVVQHTLFRRTHPTPEQLSTLLARLGALMGHDRFGAPATVDSDRPGAFAMAPFATEHSDQRRDRSDRRENTSPSSAHSADSAFQGQAAVPGPRPLAPSPQSPLVSALRRCRCPVPARVALADGRPVRVTTDRRGYAGGAVLHCVGPWRTSGEWWVDPPHATHPSDATHATHLSQKTHATYLSHATHPSFWDHDEWDVSLSDGSVYRIFQDRASDRWFIDAIVD